MFVKGRISMAFLVCKMNAFLIKIPIGFFMEIEELMAIVIKKTRSFYRIKWGGVTRVIPGRNSQSCYWDDTALAQLHK